MSIPEILNQLYTTGILAFAIILLAMAVLVHAQVNLKSPRKRVHKNS